MPAIKITLSRLIELFGQSVNSLPEGPVRSLAAQLMTLTAHVIRVEQKGDTQVAQMKDLGTQISTLTDIVQELASRMSGTTAVVPTPVAVTQGAAPTTSPTPTAPDVEQEEEPTADDEFEARMRAEVDAEIAAANGTPSEVVVVSRGVQ